MRVKIRTLLLSPGAARFLYRLVRAYTRTFRLRVINEEPWLTFLKGGGKVLLCAWHQQFFPILRYFETYRIYKPSIMISRSDDGELIARFAERSGWLPVRGSSSKGGKEALRVMIEKLKETGFAAHIVDGPRGPAGKVKHGVVHLAQAAGAVVVPFYVSADRAWYLNSWDRFCVPKPFARVTLLFGDMISLPPTDDAERLDEQRRNLEKIMAPGLKI